MRIALRNVRPKVNVSAPAAAAPAAPAASAALTVRATKKSQALAAHMHGSHGVSAAADKGARTCGGLARNGAPAIASTSSSAVKHRGGAIVPHAAPPRPDEVALGLQQVQRESQRAALVLAASASSSMAAGGAEAAPLPAQESAPGSRAAYAAPPLPAEVAQLRVARALERELGLPV